MTALVRGTDGIAAADRLSASMSRPIRAGRPPKLKKRACCCSRARCRDADQVQLVAPDAQLRWTPGAGRTDPPDRRATRRGRCAAGDHRDRQRLPRPRLAPRRGRDPDLPDHREQRAGIAVDPAPPGRAAALGGRAERDRRRGRAPRRRAIRCSGIASPARCRRRLPDRSTAALEPADAAIARRGLRASCSPRSAPAADAVADAV